MSHNAWHTSNNGSAYNNPMENPLDALQGTTQQSPWNFSGAQNQSLAGGSGQPAGSVAPPPAATAPQGGITPPGGTPGGTGIPGVGGGTGTPVFTAPDGTTTDVPNPVNPQEQQNLNNLMQIQQMLQAAGINLPGMGQPIDPNNLGDNPFVLDQLSGFLRDSGLGMDPNQPGGSALGFGAALSFADYLQGAGRGQQREQLLGNVAQDARNSGAFSTGQDLSSAAQRVLEPGYLDDRFRGLEMEARLQNRDSLNSQRNYLQDIGLAGAGMGQAPALLGAERGSARDLQSTLNQLDAMRAQEDARNIQAATGAAATGTDIYRALGIEPQLNIASSLGGPQNIQSQQFQNTMSNIGQLGHGTALAQQSPSTLQQLAPILGGGLGALGSIGGGLAGNTSLFNQTPVG